VLADCGYASKEDFQRLGRQRPGLALYGSVHWEEAHAPRRYDDRLLDKVKSPRRLRDPVWVAMAEKLKTPEGQAPDRRRLCTVEPAFGVIQAVLGFGPFLVRGLQKVRGEWALVCLAYNGSGCTGSGRGWAWRGRAELWGLWLSSAWVGPQCCPLEWSRGFAPNRIRSVGTAERPTAPEDCVKSPTGPLIGGSMYSTRRKAWLRG
jgi:hypothetical protein